MDTENTSHFEPKLLLASLSLANMPDISLFLRFAWDFMLPDDILAVFAALCTLRLRK